MVVSLTDEKKDERKRITKTILSSNVITICNLAECIGKLVASFPAVMEGPLYYCQLEHTKKQNRKHDLILIMTPEKQDKTLELSKHWSVDSTPARNEVIMKRTYPVKSVKCDKICSNY